MNDEQMNYERANVFFNKKIVVHISKIDGIYYNGLITEVNNNCFFIDDKEDGRQLVFFKELAKPIQEYKEAER
jgi:hypothetical protein